MEIAGTSAGSTNHKIAYFDGNWHDTDITLSLGTWYHVIFTYDGTTAKFYINNELQDEHALAGRSLSGTMRIGNRVQQLDEGINGKIDDVRIYDYALNSTQIGNLADGSNNPDGDPSPTPTPSPTASTRASSTSSTTGTATVKECTDSVPTSTPNLFQVSTSFDSATLYFSPVLSATDYVISYGQNNYADQHSVSFEQRDKSGVVSYTIGSLASNTRYYFKVRGMNGCAPGDWSTTLSETTTTYSPVLPTASMKQLALKTSDASHVQETESRTNNASSQPPTNAQQPEVEGHNVTIKVENQGKPVAGATVELHSIPRRTTTDADGLARFSNVEKGEHTVKLAYNSYQGEQKVIVDGEQKDIAIAVTLVMKPTWYHKSVVFVVGITSLVAALFMFYFWKKGKK